MVLFPQTESITGVACAAVKILNPKYRLDHSENDLFLLPKKCVDRINVSKKQRIGLETKIHWYARGRSSVTRYDGIVSGKCNRVGGISSHPKKCGV